MWESHWNLTRDPFAEGARHFVPTPAHAEAIARLADAIEAGRRSATLRAAAGLGKSMVLARALAETKGPTRRVARATSPVDGPALLAGLAEGLGLRVPPGSGRPLAWRRLVDAVRLCHCQGLAVVLAIDDCQVLTDAADRADLERLVHLAPGGGAPLTVLRVGRSSREEPMAISGWELAIRLTPLTRGESERYVAAKLASAGREALTFTPRALTSLHALSKGIPRGLDRLASLALMAGAVRRLEVIPPDVVEGVARECLGCY